MARETILDQKITDINVPWYSEGEYSYKGNRVEEFLKEQLKAKAGFMVRSTEKEQDGSYHLRGFFSEETYNEWNSDREEYADNVLFDIALPDTGGGSPTATSYILQLVNGSERNILATSKDVTVRLRFTSQVFNPATQQTTDTGEMGTLTIQTKLEGASSWGTKATLPIQSVDAAETEAWTEVNIGQYLSLGTQNVRCIVRGETTEVSTTYVSYSITLTNLGVTFASEWEKPFFAERIPLLFYVTGNIAKDLHVTVSGGDYSETYTRSLGTQVYTEVPYTLEVDHPGTHGVYTVTAWLTTNNGDAQTENVTAAVMAAVEGQTQVLMAVNNIRRNITNWNNEKLFDWAVYNPSADTTPVTLSLKNDDLSADYYVQDIPAAANGERYELSTVIEIETEDPISTINAKMIFMSGDTQLRGQLLFYVDNSNNFAPTAGADFVLNVKQRHNSEANPLQIFNHEGGAVIPSTWNGFGLYHDGWVTDANGNKCLRVLAGQSLHIDYESFSQNTGLSQADSLAIELDFASRNATDLEEAIIRMCSTLSADGLPLGLEVRPQSAYFLTLGKRVMSDQDVMFEEDKRVRMAVNIVYNLENKGVNYVRIFLNGGIRREFTYTSQDRFVQLQDGVYSSGGIDIGSTTSDVDLYGIRVYKKALSANDIRQDYMSGLATVEEKIAYRAKNDITYNNTISYEMAKLQYNTMLWTGSLPYILDQGKKTGDLAIDIVGDPAHSGTFAGIPTKGQGSSSKKYFKWNQQFDVSEADWIDGNGTNRGKGYQLADGLPMATKLVAKLNWASSMQSHKMGACDLYYDVWKEVVGGNSITATEGYENVRPCVKQLPFMLFTREDASSDPVFYGLVTFGPGKGDEPTFGVDLETFPDYMMIEGSDNGAVLALHQVPWNDDVVEMYEDDELAGWGYNGTLSYDYGWGTSSLSYFIAAHNFTYLSSNRVAPFIGNVAALRASASLERNKMYWVTEASAGSERYDLYRYDYITSTWVDAGVEKLGVGSYEKLNLRTQLSSFLAAGFDASDEVTNQDWTAVNGMFVAARVKRFREGAGNYYNLSDTRFTIQMMKLLGASDNRCKNTYLYVDPVTHLICFMQDDLDTIFATDNSGRKNKPYYVEEHDVNPLNGSAYWNGETNALYNVFEEAFPSELRSTMKAILTAMEGLGDTAYGAFGKYFFSIQEYFPDVAYNETARLLYEYGEWQTQLGNYNPPSVSAISQSLGSQLECERQWVKDRVTYMSSYCSYGDFDVSSAQSIAFRSRYKKDGSQPTYTFKLRPFMWLYPAMAVGQSLNYGKDANGKSYTLPQRVQAGEEYTISFATDSDTPCALLAPDCYSSLGDWGDKPITGEFAVKGKRLTEFSAGAEEGISTVEFNASSIVVTAPNLTRLNLNDVTGLSGIIDASHLIRAVEIDLGGTAFTSVTASYLSFLNEMVLPSQVSSITLEKLPALQALTVTSADSLESVRVIGVPSSLDTYGLVEGAIAASADGLKEVYMEGINWQNASGGVLSRLVDINAHLTGDINVPGNHQMTFALKTRLLAAYGNIDSADNPLRVTYTAVNLTSIKLSGKRNFAAIGTYSLTAVPNTPYGNTHTSVRWELTTNSYATVNAVTGEITVSKTGTAELAPSATLSVTVTINNGSTVSDSVLLGFYEREVQLGDYLYADGSTDSVLDTTRTPVALCFYINPNNKMQRLAVSLNNIGSYQWGMYPSDFSGLTLADNPNYSVFDIAAIPNRGSSGISGNISDTTYRDEVTGDADGYKIFAQDTVCGELYWVTLDEPLGEYKAGDEIPIGLKYTLEIIKHRDIILTDSSINLPLPAATPNQSKIDNLKQLMNEVVANNGNAAKYREYYYPAASLCNAYEPVASKPGEVLDDKFKSGKWFLTAGGELARLVYHHIKGYDASVERAIFAKPFADGVFAKLAASDFWSSSEPSANGAWYINASSGQVSNPYHKYFSIYGRAVVAF